LCKAQLRAAPANARQARRAGQKQKAMKKGEDDLAAEVIFADRAFTPDYPRP